MALPLDSVMTAINAANVRLNGKVETLQAVGGQIVGNTNSFSQQVVNSAWRKLMSRLADGRFSEMQAEIVFVAVPAVLSADPMVQVYIGGAGYYNGSSVVGAPILPATFLRPYEMWERQNGTANIFTLMDPLLYTMPRVVKAGWNRQWLWRNGNIYMPGATQITDIALTYANLFVDFLDGANPWFQQTIPVLNAIDALSAYICQEIYTSRKDVASAAAMQQMAEDAAALMCNQDGVGPKSILKASEFGKMRDQYTPGGPVNPAA